MNKALRLPFIVLFSTASLLFTSRHLPAAPEESSFATEILQDVRQDKVYLLEKIRRKLIKPSEKTLVEALLTEDGPKAAALYRLQLAEYPDQLLDPVSRARLAAYEETVGMTASHPAPQPARPAVITPVRQAPVRIVNKPLAYTRHVPVTQPDTVQAPPLTAKPQPAPVAKIPAKSQPTPVAKPASGGSFTLQFGSFDNAANASQLVSQIASSSPASVVLINGVYKVRLKQTFSTRSDATSFSRRLPVESFVVTVQP